MGKPVHTLDEAKLAEYLQTEINGFQGPLRAEKFAGGQSNPTFLITAASGQYVLRRKPPGTLLKSAHAVDREFAVLKALQNTDVPVATPYCLCEDDDVIGSMFYLMSYEQGRIFWDPALPEIDKAERSRYYDEMIRVLAAMHNVDVKSVGLGNFGKQGNYYERQLRLWERQYRAAETDKIDAMEELLSWLPAQLPKESGSSLIHGDYRIDNLIFDPQEPKALAVLDWELSTLGDPLSDIAYFCACLRLPPMGPVKGLAGVDRANLGIPSEQDIVARYCELRDLDSIDDWNFYLTFSLFRFAAIAQGVYKRALDGNASSEQAIGLGKSARMLADLALTISREK